MIKSELCNPPSFLSKSIKPVARPAILPSRLKALFIISVAFFRASLKEMYFLSILPI